MLRYWRVSVQLYARRRWGIRMVSCEASMRSRLWFEVRRVGFHTVQESEIPA